MEFAPADPAAQKRYFTTGYKGRVEATVPYGTYKVSVSFLGYETLEKELKLSAAKKSLGTLELAPSSTEIEAVVKEVKSMRTSQKGDTATGRNSTLEFVAGRKTYVICIVTKRQDRV